MKTVRGICCAAALAMLLGTWGCSPSLSPEHRGEVMPGQGIKDMALGEDRAAVEKVWGAPADVYENPFDKSNVIVAYPQKGVEVSYRSGKVDCVNLYPTKDNWVCYEGGTQEGVWVNSPESEVRRALGEPADEAPQALNYPGLTVFLENGKVSYLAVTAKTSPAATSTAPAATPAQADQAAAPSAVAAPASGIQGDESAAKGTQSGVTASTAPSAPAVPSSGANAKDSGASSESAGDETSAAAAIESLQKHAAEALKK